MIDSRRILLISIRTALLLLLQTCTQQTVRTQEDLFNQEWRWVHFTIEDGLPSNHVYGLVETPNGIVWAATTAGLAWYDGFQWRSVRDTANIGHRPPSWIAQGHGDSLLVVIDQRLYIGTTQQFNLVPLSFNHNDLDVLGAAPLDDHRYLIYTIGTPALWIVDTTGLKPLNQLDSSHVIPPFHYTEAGTIWVNTFLGLYRWSGHQWERKLSSVSKTALKVSRLIEAADGMTFASLIGPIELRGLWEWKRRGPPRHLVREGKEVVQELAHSPDGRTIAVYRSATIRVSDGKGWSSLPVVPSELRDVLFLKFRRNSDLWVGTERGLFLYRNSSTRWTYWKHPFPSNANTIHEICRTRDGSIWLATNQGIEVHRSGGRTTAITEVNGQDLNGITGLCEDIHGDIWVSSGAMFEGAYRWGGNVWRHFDSHDGLDATRIHKICMDRSGRLWFLGIGIFRDDPVQPGAFMYDGERFTRWSTKRGLLSDRVYSFAHGLDGSLWFGTDNGLSRWNNGVWKHWKGFTPFALAIDRNDRLWIGNRDLGLAYIDEHDRVQYANNADDMTIGSVWDLKVDSSGTLWVATRDQGVLSYHDGVWSHFSLATGLGTTVVWPLLYSGGCLYIGTDGGGVNILNNAEAKNPPPRVEIIEPAIDNENALLRWQAHAFWGELATRDVKTRYRLDNGKWSGWTNERELNLVGLHAGSHRFYVQAKSLFGNFDSTGQSATFVIAPPLYLRPSFAVPVSVLSIVVMSLVTNTIVRRRRYNRQIHEREARLHSITESTSSAIFIVQNAVIRFVNSSAVELTAFTREELLGMPLVDLVHTEQQKSMTEHLAQTFTSRHDRFECKLLTKDHRDLWVGCTLGKVEYAGVPAVIATAVDITERKQAEEKLLAHQGMLQSLAAELAQSEERERRRMAMYLHDYIGQALALCRLHLGTPGSIVPSHDLDEIRKYIDQATQHTQSLTFDLSPPVLYELSFEDAMEWLIERVEREHRLPITLQVQGEPVSLDQDTRAFLFHVVRELLLNVVKHAQAFSVKVLMQADGGRITIVVQDDGKGFDTAVLADHTGGATHFGLLNVRQRLQHLGGSLEIDSRLGEGTRLTLTLPLMDKSNANNGKKS